MSREEAGASYSDGEEEFVLAREVGSEKGKRTSPGGIKLKQGRLGSFGNFTDDCTLSPRGSMSRKDTYKSADSLYSMASLILGTESEKAAPGPPRSAKVSFRMSKTSKTHCEVEDEFNLNLGDKEKGFGEDLDDRMKSFAYSKISKQNAAASVVSPTHKGTSSFSPGSRTINVTSSNTPVKTAGGDSASKVGVSRLKVVASGAGMKKAVPKTLSEDFPEGGTGKNENKVAGNWNAKIKGPRSLPPKVDSKLKLNLKSNSDDDSDECPIFVSRR